ncbi:hypothetical protein I4J48_04700 [Pseudonocardia sp. KRD-169]|uniref:Uncharacterized protein n=2 Tax=Pseudonocardia abyssalis TaxID=2792008 RepID=A0ABS6US08_9PSEU|nr:hypothetical protein [Pseudonocardia abyssalis]MBW0135048.1 hypothetical protein [Pseudonocardia abyssalis]
MVSDTRTTATMLTRAMDGVLAGLAGGVMFGALMAMMGMLPMVAMLVGSTSPVVGAIVHLVISAGLGVLFALVVPAWSVAMTLVAGAVYGVVWWVLGPLLIMPTVLGMSQMVFVVDTTALFSLMGHVIFGVVAAAVLVALRRRRARA